VTTTGAALLPLVDALVAERLDELPIAALQDRIAVVAPQVARLQGWLMTVAGQLDQVSGGQVPGDDEGRKRSVAGWLAHVQTSTPSAAGAQVRIARLLRAMPLVADAVLTGVLTPRAGQQCSAASSPRSTMTRCSSPSRS
jgi:hypothetical protein